MTQDRFGQWSRSIIWRAAIDTLNEYRYDRRPWRHPVLIKITKAVGSWVPGEPDDDVSDQDVIDLISDIAAAICRRVESDLNRVDPPELSKATKHKPKLELVAGGKGNETQCSDIQGELSQTETKQASPVLPGKQDPDDD